MAMSPILAEILTELYQKDLALAQAQREIAERDERIKALEAQLVPPAESPA